MHPLGPDLAIKPPWGAMPDTTDSAWTGLVSWWPMLAGSGPATMDYVANQDATRVGGATWAGGFHGPAISFDGSTGYLNPSNITSKYSFIQNTLTFTIAAWIRLANLGGRLSICGDTGGSANSGFLFIWETLGSGFGDHSLRLLVAKGVAGTLAIDGHSNDNATILDALPHHVVVTGTGSSVTFWVDGLSKSTTYSTSFTGLGSGNSTQGIFLGAFNNGGSPALPFNGLISDMRIYNRTLAPGEIQRLAWEPGAGWMPEIMPLPAIIPSTGIFALGRPFADATGGGIFALGRTAR